MSPDRYRDRVMGCWIGKAVGGTLGMPFEGCAGPLAIDFGEMADRMLPNDDLDLQLLWLHVLEEFGPATRAVHLAAAASRYYACYPDEYGVARWNTARGFVPPLTGSHNNAFGEGMGAAIRSEIWACLAPGKPDLAAALAREDALVDHHGNGVWAEMFLAALESALFSRCDLPHAIERALRVIPEDCKLAWALRTTRSACDGVQSAGEVRSLVMRNYPSNNFTDVTLNLCFILIALLYGQGDMERTLCLAVNAGLDTDCTGATCGAILGILHGASALPFSIVERAGEAVVAHPSLAELPLPKTLEELTERTMQCGGVYAAIPDQALAEPTPETAPEPDDPHEWLVFRVPVEEGCVPPPALAGAERDPGAAPDAARVRFNGIHADLRAWVQQPGDTLFLLTWLRTPSRRANQLMACADAGITVWWDGRKVVNYHGRKPSLPALHRTEGGATVPVDVVPNQWHCVKVRLLTGSGPLRLTVALGDDEDRYIHPVDYAIPSPAPEH